GKNYVPVQVEVKASPQVNVPPEILRQLDMVQTMIEEATFPNVIRGVRPKGVSTGFGISVLAGMGRLVFQGVADGLARMMEEVNGKRLKLIENKNFWMYYTTEWTTPVAGTGSEYPAHLDELVSKGALGFLLIGLSVKKTIESASELALANAELDLNDAIYTAITTDAIHAGLKSAVDNITNTLASVTLPRANFTTAIDAAATALGNVSDHTKITIALDLVNTTLDSVSWTEFLERLDDVTKKDALEGATAAITALAALTTEGFGDYDTALSAANTTLDSAATAAAASDPTAASTPLSKPSTMITGAADTLQEHETDAQADLTTGTDTHVGGAAAPSGKKYLDDGDAFIDNVNTGEDVATNYAQYSLAATRMGEALIAAAQVETQMGA
ncbi:hypothetical protein LCGC14_2897310, partial [marine sediment metagenome]